MEAWSSRRETGDWLDRLRRARQDCAMPMATITAERPDTPDAVLLIDELHTHLQSFYPPESRHGFSVDRLIKEGVAFFVLRVQKAAIRLYERLGFRRIPPFGPYTDDP